jgi:hypothetical protein
MRKKKGNSLDATTINLAWQCLFDKNKIHSIEELKKDGWISIHEASEQLNRSRVSTKDLLKKSGAEYKQFVIRVYGAAKNTGFFRLKH